MDKAKQYRGLMDEGLRRLRTAQYFVEDGACLDAARCAKEAAGYFEKASAVKNEWITGELAKEKEKGKGKGRKS